jgi:uncharacterized protein (DUF305 family)
MTPSRNRGIAAMLSTVAAALLCIGPAQAFAQQSTQSVADTLGEGAAIAKARADSARYPYTVADIQFMTGMIAHHSQAIKMASWAPTHGASPSIQLLASRITNSQRDEIHTMQQWLRDRQQPVPDPGAPMHMAMNGSSMAMGDSAQQQPLMPGMLTDAQLKQLDAAHGPEFDRLFLTFMIQHHTGAITMVKNLFNTYGAGQDEIVFKLASDANVDQTTEIARMRRMLVAQMFDVGSE